MNKIQRILHSNHARSSYATWPKKYPACACELSFNFKVLHTSFKFNGLSSINMLCIFYVIKIAQKYF